MSACRPPELVCDEPHAVDDVVTLNLAGTPVEVLCAQALRGNTRIDEGWAFVQLRATLDYDRTAGEAAPVLLCEFELPVDAQHAVVPGRYPVGPSLSSPGANCVYRPRADEARPASGEFWTTASGVFDITAVLGDQLVGGLTAQLAEPADLSQHFAAMVLRFDLVTSAPDAGAATGDGTDAMEAIEAIDARDARDARDG